MEPTGSHHINCDLELLAVLFDNNKGFMWEICKFSDLGSMCYTTAVCYINNMGGSKSPDCNSVARQIWNYFVECYTWISASPLPECENSEADRKSRHFNDRTEWQSHIILLIYQAIWSAKHWFDCISLKKAISSLCLMEAWSRCLEKIQANRALRGKSGGVFLDLPKLVSQIAETTGGSSLDNHSQGNPSDYLPGCQKVHPLRQKLVLYAETLQAQRLFWESNQYYSPFLAPIITETVWWCTHQKMASLLY